MTDIIFGGIQGGATHSTLVLLNGLGEELVECTGPGTNHWILGMDECQKRINAMVEQAKSRANIDKPLTSLGLCLSGCEQDESNQELEKGLEKNFPDLSKNYIVKSDTVGSVLAAHKKGGIVLIAGTGSNSLLLNPDGKMYGCGGWGYFLGDEAGAWWISQMAIKIYFDEQDNFKKPPHSTEKVWQLIKKHFDVKNRTDLLEHCYKNFEKSFFAGLCSLLATGAQDGDPLCRWLFAQAGQALGGYIVALYPKADSSLVNCDGGIPVVCDGSVWHSWEFMKPGFVSELKKNPQIKKLSLMKLTTSMGTGAAYLAANHIGFDFPRNYSKNYSVFYQYKCESS